MYVNENETLARRPKAKKKTKGDLKRKKKYKKPKINKINNKTKTE